MFFSHNLLAKKGPLAKVWLAAHCNWKLKKTQVLQADVATSVDHIINPTAPLALRLSGHLLLGVVRIYSLKASYLLNDCSDAFKTMSLSSKTALVDMAGDTIVPLSAITADPDHLDLDFFMDEPTYSLALAEEGRHQLSQLSSFQAGAGGAVPSTPSSSNHKIDLDLDDPVESINLGTPRALSMSGAADDDIGMLPNSDWLLNPDQDLSIERARAAPDLLPMDDAPDFDLDMPMPSADAPLDAPLTHDQINDEAARRESLPDFLGTPTGGAGAGVDAPVRNSLGSPISDIGVFSPGVLRTPGTPAAAARKPRKASKRSRVVVDAPSELRSQFIKASLKDTRDIVYELGAPSSALAPPDTYGRDVQADIRAIFGQPMLFAVPGMARELIDFLGDRRAGGKRKRSADGDDAEVEGGAGASKKGGEGGEAAAADDDDDDGSIERARKAAAVPEPMDDAPDFDLDIDMPVPGEMPGETEAPLEVPMASLAGTPGGVSLDSVDPPMGDELPSPMVGDAPSTTASGSGFVVDRKHSSWNPGTVKVLRKLDAALADKEAVGFSELAAKQTKGGAARTFFEILVLKTRNYVDVDQNGPGADISISKARSWDP